MSDEKEEKPFLIEVAKNNRAACKKCKQKCENGSLRIAKLVANYFSDSGMIKHWYHVDCLFEVFKSQKATTKRIDSIEDIDGWDLLSEDTRDEILEKINNSTSNACPKGRVATPKMEPADVISKDKTPKFESDSKDNSFAAFCRICEKIANERSYTMKSEILQKFLIKGTSKKQFEGDIYLWLKLMLPSAVRRIYNLQSKQLVKIFSRVFRTDQQDMLTDLEQGDVSETIRKSFEKSTKVQPNDKSSLTIKEIDKFLDNLSKITKEDDQTDEFSKFCKKANADDLKMVIRIIKHDLKINAGPRHILDALDSSAYQSFQLSRDLKSVVDKFAPSIAYNKINSIDGGSESISKKIGVGVQIMSPISPMLAEACKSVAKAISKNPEGMYSEIKYDGERVQIHKRGNDFKFFSRSLKAVMDHKIARCKEFIPKAFPSGQDMVLDSEIIMVNTETGELLPFGTLGVHKREQFKSSEVCLFIFDCIYYNGEDLTKRPLHERKSILQKNIKPIKNHVQLSEFYLVKTEKELSLMTAKVLKAGLEGLVLKNINSPYQPGKRGWLKVKKDYLFEGQMADTADLVVLGGWFGTGKKGGMLSIFLMGCLDTNTKIWKTVTKVHSGLDDSAMEALQDNLMALTERSDSDRIPKFMACKKSLVPDLIARDPMTMPVWEITGAEFTKSEAHTADGISIRFPRITKIRDDKTAKEATTLDELKMLYATSKDNVNIDMLYKGINDCPDVDIKTKFFKVEDDDSNSSSPTKRQSTSPLKAGEKRIKLENVNDKSPKKKKMKKEDIKEETSKPSPIFDKIIVYIHPRAKILLQNDLKKFQQFQGSITEKSMEANVALHPEEKSSVTIAECRNTFKRSCRHLTFKWLIDSVEKRKCLEYPQYAVTV